LLSGDDMGCNMPVEQRHLTDRRTRPTSCLSRYTLTGRRKMARRRNESVNYYVDRYEQRYVIILGLVLIMCLLDCGLSFRIHEAGGSEINWLTVNLMKSNRILLILIKVSLTLLGMVILIVHKNFKVLSLFRTTNAIYLILAVYLILTSYELYGVLSLKSILFVP